VVTHVTDVVTHVIRRGYPRYGRGYPRYRRGYPRYSRDFQLGVSVIFNFTGSDNYRNHFAQLNSQKTKY
jgi:hypothetical protein